MPSEAEKEFFMELLMKDVEFFSSDRNKSKYKELDNLFIETFCNSSKNNHQEVPHQVSQKEGFCKEIKREAKQTGSSPDHTPSCCSK